MVPRTLIVHVRSLVSAEDVFVNESAHVGDFLHEATAVLRSLYPPLANFNARRLWMEGALCSEADETPMRNFVRGRDQTIPALVELEGPGIDMGQPEVETVRCSCGYVLSHSATHRHSAQWNPFGFLPGCTIKLTVVLVQSN